ncbi:trypsin-like peptidase domain-containing protein [Oligoflexus tunisiensis]|uniref:trypsin-like peptidase domain-containing protein n=1 Tax=Oligoflexus tunisiensis TaxID=708132 RepID=UPI00114CC733|nr:trypsin-like peptidase domain-containing protein [Oligoflexus tunisiensis]
MVRSWYFLIPLFFLGCTSFSEQRHGSAQFMQARAESKATRLQDTVDNQRLAQVLALVDSSQSCSGVLIGKASSPESPAYLLTAGHCLMDFEEVSASNHVFLDALPRSDRNMIRFPKRDFRIGRVVYASMKTVDLAIAEITEEDSAASLLHLTERRELETDEAKVPRAVTLQRLKGLGMEPLRWASGLPAFGDAIRIISAGADEESDASYRREHRCRHEDLADVVESIWHWRGLARNNCEDILPGSSGAPVLDAQSALFAIVNTSSRNALSQDCYLGQPCELSEKSFQVAASRNYGTVVLDLPACFNARGFFSLDESRCPLPRAASVRLVHRVKTPVNPQALKAEERRWNVQAKPVDRSSTGFRYKSGPLPELNCRQSAGYSERLPWSDPRLRDLALPTGGGLYMLCVIPEEDFQRQELRQAARIVLNIDTEAPRLKPRLLSHPTTQEPLMSVRKSCRNLPAGAPYNRRRQCAVAVLSFEQQPYEVVDFYYGLIASKSQDCRSMKHEGRGLQVHVPVSALPAKLCAWAVDGAGNRAEEPSLFSIRAASRREIVEATDVMMD